MTDSMRIRSNSHESSAIFIAILFISPLSIRVLLGAIAPVERSYDRIDIGTLITDPSVIAYSLSALLLAVGVLTRRYSLDALFRAPLVLLLGYILFGVIFGIMSSQYALGVFIGIELLVYCSIVAACIFVVNKEGAHTGRILENAVYLFYSLCLAVAAVDIALHGQSSFSDDARPRFEGTFLYLKPIQWGVVAAVVATIALRRLWVDRKQQTLNLLVFAWAICVIYLAGTRGAIFGAAFAMTIILLKAEFWSVRRLIILFILLLGSLAAFVSLLDDNAQLESSSVRLDDVENVSRLGGRLALWEIVIPYLLDRPLEGHGIGIRETDAPIVGSVHNSFLQAWFDAGLVGGILFLGAFLAVGWRLMLMTTGRSDVGIEQRALCLGALALCGYIGAHGSVESGVAGVGNFMSVPFLYCVVIAQGLRR